MYVTIECGMSTSWHGVQTCSHCHTEEHSLLLSAVHLASLGMLTICKPDRSPAPVPRVLSTQLVQSIIPVYALHSSSLCSPQGLLSSTTQYRFASIIMFFNSHQMGAYFRVIAGRVSSTDSMTHWASCAYRD